MDDHRMTRRRKHNFRPPNEYDEMDEKETRRRTRDQNLLPKENWLLVIAVFALAYLVVNYYDNYRPPIVPASDYSRFSEERARMTTVELSEIGPRPSGSEALEKAAFEFITGKIAKVAEIKGVNRLEMDIQRPSACFDVDFISPFTNCYHKVSNIVVRMGPSDSVQSNHSFLLNCHYDTQPDAPGATDDAVSCAVMLDIMEILVRGDEKLKNDVIFLFNGAEETGLQAAHGFITQHPWRHSVRAFINLEGAGSGGREILFQTGPGNPWLADVYVNSVPHPSCSILGQELFQAKVIPSDTDFRIFRDFGRISGLDIAYYRNGWVYHTEFDQHFRIQQGDIQRTGENILALVRGLDASEYIAQPGNFEDKTKAVFFDLLGKIVFKLSFDVAIAINIITVLWSAFSVAKSHNPYFYRALTISFVTTFLPSCLVLVFSARLFGFQFFWHKAIWQVYIFYFFTHVLCGLYVNCCWVSDDKKVRLEKAKAFHDAFLVILTGLLVLAMLPQKLNGSSIYLSLFLLAAKSKDLFQFIFSRLDLFNEEKSLFYSILLSHFPFAILHFYLTSLLLYLMVPIMGRTGMKIPDPDMLIFFATNILSSFFIWSLTPLVQLTDWKRDNRNESFLVRHKTVWIYFTAVIGLLAFTSLGTSYQFDETMPKLRRVHATHMDRTIYNFDGSIHEQESGILIQGLDFRKGDDFPRDDEDFSRMKGINCSRFKNYGDEACAFPFVVPKWTIFRPEHAQLIPASRVQFPKPIYLKMVQRKFIVFEGERRLRIEFELRGGADKMGIHVSPTDLYGIANSSLTHDRAVLNRNLAINTTYFATLDHGAEHPGVRRFWFDLATRKTNPMHDPEKKKNLEIVVVSLYTYGPHQHTPELRALRDKIHEKRKNPRADWRWLMTLVAASAEVKVFYF